jgi:serine phosphatase RsbU (regulator of sigma subunit)/putative methionine-R-sulfoxide reductase with GAF domain
LKGKGIKPAQESAIPLLSFHPRLATTYSLLIGLIGLGTLGYGLSTYENILPWLSITIFVILSLIVQRSSFHLGSPITHSLSGLIDVAAMLALGPVPGATVAAFSGFSYLQLNAIRHGRLTRHSLLEVPLFNAGLKALMVLVGGALFVAIAQPSGPDWLSAPASVGHLISAVAVVCLAWFALDHIGWGFRDYLAGGQKKLHTFIQDALPNALWLELLPLPLGLLVALIFVHLDWLAFALAALAIIAVSLLTQRWADAREKLIQRVAELSTIEQVGRAIAQAQLDVDAICKLMYDHASRIADTTIFHLGLFDGDEYTIQLWMREGEPEPRRTFHLAQGIGLVNWLRESKQPILVRDFEKEMDSLPAKPAYVSERPPRSALFAPLMAGETVIGTMSIQSFRRNAYEDSDLRVLSAMANQAAVAIQKAQLFAQERKRGRQLETIGQVSRQVAAILDLEELFEQVVHLIRENFGYYHVAIYTANRERETVTLRASASADEQDVAFDVAWEQGLIGWVAAHGEAIIVNDVENDTRYRCVEALDETRSELATPLLLDGELVGVLDVQSDQLDAFGPDDLFILKTLGDQVAVAIQEARLYQAEQEQAWLSTALLQVADAMSQVSDMDAVLTTIVRLTPLLAGVDRCAILLWEADTETFIPAQTYGLTPELRDIFDQMLFPVEAMPALDLLRWDKSPLLINVDRDVGLLPDHIIKLFDIQEMVFLPLLAQGELLGTMMVDYAGQPHYFDERMIDMLTGIANQAAMVIQSAHLVQAQREEAYVSMALLQVAEAVGRSTDLDEVLETVARITPILVGVERCAIFLWDPSTSTFVPSQQYGLPKSTQSDFWQMRFAAEDPLARKLMSGKPVVAEQELVEGLPIAPLSGESSLLALPLASRGEVWGGMFVDYTGSAQRFTHRRMNILTGISGQAAIAVENDRLLQEAAEQERLKQELDVARRIQTSFLPEQCPNLPGWELAVIWRSAREVGGDFYDFVPLPAAREQANPSGVVIADVADKGVPAALFMALSRTLMRTVAIDGRQPAAAVARANDLIVADARSELFVTLFYAILQPNSAEVSYVNAGHMPPLLVRATDGSTEELRTNGMALGVLPDLEFEERTAHLAPGDTLILYTDGVIEASNAGQEMFGKERLIETVRTHHHESAQKMAKTLNDTISAFVGEAPQFDDLTLVVAKRTV